MNTTPNNTQPKEKWHADKRIPILSLIGLMLQTATLVWFLATFTANTNSRLDALEAWIEKNDKLASDIAVMQTNVTYIKEDQKLIKSMLQQIQNNLVNK